MFFQISRHIAPLKMMKAHIEVLRLPLKITPIMTMRNPGIIHE